MLSPADSEPQFCAQVSTCACLLADAGDAIVYTPASCSTCLLSQPAGTGQLHWKRARLGQITSRPTDDPSAKKREGRDNTMPKSNSRRLDKDEKNVLLHLLQAPKLTNCDIAR